MKINKKLWAKKQENGASFQWIPLYIHLSDTKNVMALLWEHWLSESQKNLIITSIKDGNEDIAKNLVTFIGAIHDIGSLFRTFGDDAMSIR